MTFKGWEGFVTVKEEKDTYGVCFDLEDDGLMGLVRGKRVLEVALKRK